MDDRARETALGREHEKVDRVRESMRDTRETLQEKRDRARETA